MLPNNNEHANHGDCGHAVQLGSCRALWTIIATQLHMYVTALLS